LWFSKLFAYAKKREKVLDVIWQGFGQKISTEKGFYLYKVKTTV